MVLTLLGAGACAMWWRPGLVAAVTTHARWMVDPTPPPDQPHTVSTVPTVPTAEAPVEPAARSRCFHQVVKTQHSDSAYGTKLVDLDSDGILDLVAIDTADSAAIRVWRGDRGGRFHAASTLAYVGVVDIDGDERLDVVYECFAQIPGGHLGVAFGTGCVARD